MGPRILLIGQGSMLGASLIAAAPNQVCAVPHTVNIENIEYNAFDAVVNMTYPPVYRRERYCEDYDSDLRVAKAIVAQRATRPQFFLMSSRKVYGNHCGKLINEDAALLATDHYGINKAITERSISQILDDRCTILRIGNVFDFELGRSSFFGIALERLRAQGEIILDCSPFTCRDFIPLADFTKSLLALIERRSTGVFNIGSGQSTPLGKIALWIIEGFGRGRLIIDSPVKNDAFALDIRRLVKEIGPLNCEISTRCREIGEQLAWTVS